jgi:hypothetical protein
MTTLGAVLTEDRRGIILRVLHDQGGFSLNEGVLQDALDRLGHKVGRDIVRDDISWLRDHELLQIAELQGGRLWTVTLTQRGEDVATGRTRVPGVKRPAPTE